MQRFWIMSLALALGAFALTGCANTWHGAGEDVENMGEKMQSSSGQE